MIDAKYTVKGETVSRNGKGFHQDYVRQAPAIDAAAKPDFDSFQNIAERTLRDGQQEKPSALALANEAAVAFRALPLARTEIEKIRNEILVLQQQHGVMSIGFAGTQSGEGNSTILANLVFDLKRTNLRVLVVDLNLAHPNLPGMFSLPNTPGLADLVDGRHSMSEAARVIKANKIFLLPLGKPAKKLSFDLENAVRAITKAGKNSKYFDLLLFDLPPLNEVPRALSAARQTDGVIQIVQAERTRVDVLRALKSKLEQAGVQSFGIVLNQRRFYIPQLIYENL